MSAFPIQKAIPFIVSSLKFAPFWLTSPVFTENTSPSDDGSRLFSVFVRKPPKTCPIKPPIHPLAAADVGLWAPVVELG